MPIRKLAVQLEKPATAMAAGRGPWENNSATKNQGMGPGPISKNATKPKMASMLTKGGMLSCDATRENIDGGLNL